ncbi:MULTISPECIES: endonuclease MutS2 [unclassified Limnothrix]|uniref:endonuclease MutS2 n=1 Tax=unclassified Limnothrix TaxID=2632864 RepID=UPI0018F027AC
MSPLPSSLIANQAESIQIETLELLEWPRLCQHLATFTATKLGAIVARQLPIPGDRRTSEALLAQTREAWELERSATGGLNFGGIADIGSALDRATRGGVLAGEELLEVATTLSGARNLRRAIDQREDLPALAALVEELRTYPELEQEIHYCIDDRGDVTDRASPKLAEVREKLRAGRDWIYQKLHNIMQQQSNAIQEPNISQRGDRFVIPVKASHKDVIRGIVHDTSSTGATLYVEPHTITEQNNRLRQWQRQEAIESEIVRRRLSEQIAEVASDLERLLAVATELDLAAARARYSFWIEGNAPRFIETGETLTLRQLRHPLLIWQQKHEQGRDVIPIDVRVDPTIRVVAITGPNTGGKTVTLKTLGLAALMAKAGLFVPAREPVELPWFSQVLADIGDEQSIEQNLSTFSGHIRRIVRILDVLEPDRPTTTDGLNVIAPERAHGGAPLPEGDFDDANNPEFNETETVGAQGLAPSADRPATNDDPNGLGAIATERAHGGAPLRERGLESLVLLDEVGAGTDPAEGSALAAALLEALADRARLTVATTHFGELKTLKYRDSRFENASVEFDDQTLSPTYRLLWGIPGRSNALSIARRLGLDEAVVTAAGDRVGGQSEDINRTIAGLEAERRRQEAKANEVAHLLQRAEFLHEQIDRKAQTLKEREEQLKQTQEAAVQKEIERARSEIAQVIRQLQRGTPTGQQAQQATAQVGEIAQRFLPSQQPKPKPKGYKPQVGERVRVPKLGGAAEVLAIDEADEEITIRMGLIKATLSFADVESLDGKKIEVQKPEPKPAPPKTKERSILRTSSNTLDIRGARVADAEIEVEQAIDRAISADFGCLWILHGKGTGKLRDGVRAHLKTHRLVERFEDAPREDGGTGVTIAYLR